jgi:hypothetical protein
VKVKLSHRRIRKQSMPSQWELEDWEAL